jgi:hypothetical protein
MLMLTKDLHTESNMASSETQTCKQLLDAFNPPQPPPNRSQSSEFVNGKYEKMACACVDDRAVSASGAACIAGAGSFTGNIGGTDTRKVEDTVERGGNCIQQAADIPGKRSFFDDGDARIVTNFRKPQEHAVSPALPYCLCFVMFVRFSVAVVINYCVRLWFLL